MAQPTRDPSDGAPRLRSRILPPFWLLFAIVLAVALDRIAPVARLIAEPWNRGGIAFIVAGVGLALAGAVQFRKRETPVLPTRKPTAMVVSGPFRFTRNPMYGGMTLVLIGFAVFLGSISPWIVPPLFAAWIRRAFVGPEEEAMERLFGDEYREYRGRVRRWI